MNDQRGVPMRLPGVRVPRSLVSDFARFGGTVEGDCLAGDLVLRDGRAIALEAASVPSRRLVMPTFTEPHVHLDKCHTADRMVNLGGDLGAAIRAQARDRQGWTQDDIRDRAGRGLSELIAADCTVIRSHVDWGNVADPGGVPMAWEVLGDLAASCSQTITLQRAALTGIDMWADPDKARRLAKRLAADGGVLGSFVYDQPEREAGLSNVFRMADTFGLALDFHVDEGLDPALDGVEKIADAALASGFEGPVLIGHACSLMTLGPDDLDRVIDKLARANITVATLPFTNLYLQGRSGGTPDRRGLTRIHEMRAGGVNVVLGADNVRDAFCPVGDHDPRKTLLLAVVAAHLDPPFGDYLPMITTGARQALGLAPRTVDGAAIGDLLSIDVRSTSELVSGSCPARRLAEVLEDHAT